MSVLNKLDSVIDTFDVSESKKDNEEHKTNENAVVVHEGISLSCTQKQLPGWSYSFDITDVIYSKQSKYQNIKIVETPIFNRCLLIDGQIQSSVRDEFIYHESLVHPAMISHPNPQIVFIGGGGECATAREVLKYKSVKKVIICDLDRDVIDASKQYLPSMYDISQKDINERVEFVIGDANKFITEYDCNTNGAIDVIIMDICDPIEAGPGIVCYLNEFYEKCKSKMSDDGVLVTQSTASDLMLYHECFTVIVNTLKSVFGENYLFPYSAYVPSFYAEWGFSLGFKNKKNSGLVMNDKEIDQRLIAKLGKCGNDTLRFYDGQTHLKMFNLPKYLRAALDKEQRVMTKETPYYQW